MGHITFIQDKVSEVERTLQAPGLHEEITVNQISIFKDILPHISNSTSTAIPKSGSRTQENGIHLVFGLENATEALKTIRTDNAK